VKVVRVTYLADFIIAAGRRYDSASSTIEIVRATGYPEITPLQLSDRSR